ncbi:SxtJ family membrane protein [Rufibacter sediminis]|uniref:Uncharacterized protein n=1 Tax=Rufibacter sediminis TaxID=2762756 RepID=A0ABR6VLR7_9BACT|nr:SxtJ family membrane protein [Rufibacter sediminis]MBC3538184.1 hypothetical protein [Rufibacter sediminis]
MASKRLETLEAAISLVVPLLFFYIFWFPNLLLVVVAGAILVLALLSVPPVPWLLQKWMALLHFVGIINTKILLAILFFGVLTPVAWVYRLFHKPAKKENSNFVQRDHTFSASDFERTF